MCIFRTKRRASLVIGKQRQTKGLQKRRWAEEEAGIEVAMGRGRGRGRGYR